MKLTEIVSGILTEAMKWQEGESGYQETGIAYFSKIDGESTFGVQLNDGTQFFLMIEQA